MLKGIPAILTPELLKVMMAMGHGDELVIADGNYPVNAHPDTVIRLDGHGVSEILRAVMKFFPLDQFRKEPVVLCANLPSEPTPTIWGEYKEIVKENCGDVGFLPIKNTDFYERTRKASALITTSETALYANIILVKGVVKE